MVHPNLVGTTIAQITFPIDVSKQAELGRAVGDPDPVWYDQAAARAAGFERPPVFPTTTVLIDHWREGSTAGLVDQLGMELSKVLHGEAAWEYFAPTYTGDVLTMVTTVRDLTTREGKRGGSMTLVTVDSDFTNQDGDLVIRRTDTLIEREL